MKKIGLALLAVLLAVGAGWAADESCTFTGTGVKQCSRQISATQANSEVSLGMVPDSWCIKSLSSSANTVYASWDGNDATADPDDSHPLEPGDIICDTLKISRIDLICDTGETATVQIIANKEKLF